jgi:STE24 endopeptidase
MGRLCRAPTRRRGKIVNLYLVVILLALLGRWLLALVADVLNLRSLREDLPGEFEGWYDAEKYAKSQRYLRVQTGFELVQDALHTAGLAVFILAGGFRILDAWARGYGLGPVATGLVFAGGLLLISTVLGMPFSVYETFAIERAFGFNRTTVRTFVMDQVKTLLLGAILGGLIFGGVIWFFERTGTLAWLCAWAAVVAFEFILVFLAPCVIMPLFNKFTPLGDGALRRAIEGYAAAQLFRMRGVFTMDGSRRSSKTNAFFTGLGRSRRIVLYDTLIANHPVPEVLAVVAHEMGHYKLGHIPKALVRSVAISGVVFWLLSLFMGSPALAEAFRVEHASTYASLVFFGILYTPLGMLISIAEGAISRRHEFAADAYAARSTGESAAMTAALKRLSVENLSNLTPHPLKVWLCDSHPPVLDRVRAIAHS